MTRLLWCTDIHLDSRSAGPTREVGERFRRDNEFDAVVLTGDVAEYSSIEYLLTEFAAGIGADKTIYWLEGNHDFYHGSIQDARKRFAEIKAPNLVWLETLDAVLFDEYALVGLYSWYDGMHGAAHKSQVVLWDFEIVGGLNQHYNDFQWTYMAQTGSRNALLATLRQLAQEAVDKAKLKLEAALQLKQHVIFATHVPPFAEAAWHEGKPSNDDWLPWMSCKHMGDMLLEVAAAHPDHKILVLCGHSHSPGEYQAAPNLKVLTGLGPRTTRFGYSGPVVAGIFDDPFSGW